MHFGSGQCVATRLYSIKVPRKHTKGSGVRGDVRTQGLSVDRSKRNTWRKMSNHLTLKPDALNQRRQDGMISDDDFRITAPNLELGQAELFKKECLLFYYPDCEGLARRIADVSGGNVELAEISWKYVSGIRNAVLDDKCIWTIIVYTRMVLCCNLFTLSCA